ncbi:hypothetical protein [Alicyclobacillus fodiniaquatilis]|uniref:Uncharacterized protein n=1 Tax=Alicyclobacillus fodiniaquatilis TaxID=1661150 RepID=A0ABW4JMK1_9BACL
MPIFLDARTSQNASYSDSISVQLTDTPQLVGQIGLIVTGAVSPIRVQLEWTLSLQSNVGIAAAVPAAPQQAFPSVTIAIVRGTLSTDTLVYSVSYNAITQVISDVASDYNVPVPNSGQLTYTMFVSTNTTGIFRVGPESFNGAAYSG